jgi:hypothetical protein
VSDPLATRAWTPVEIALLDRTPLIRLAAENPDGTLGPFVTIGHVRLGRDEFVRSLNGTTGLWCVRAVTTGQGVIDVDGRRLEMLFRPSSERNREFDEALPARYGDDAGTRRMVRAAARDATVQVLALTRPGQAIRLDRLP